jgi:hypothetical protein
MLEGGGWSAPRSSRFTPGKGPVPIVQEAGWAPGQVWTCAKNLAPTGIRSPDRPARSQSLYQLSYRAHISDGLCNTVTQRNTEQHTLKIYNEAEVCFHLFFNSTSDVMRCELQIHAYWHPGNNPLVLTVREI